MSLKIAIVCSDFNKPVSEKILQGCLKYCKKNFGIIGDKSENKILYSPEIHHVNGAVEIPLLCQQLLKKFDAVIALGVVIKGDTAHFDYVCKAVTDGVMRVMLDSQKVIGFGVLMTYNSQQAFDRVGDNESNKGYTCAQTVHQRLINSC